MPNLIPVVFFETQHFRVRAWDFADLISLKTGINSPSVAKGFDTNYPYTDLDAQQYIKKVLQKQDGPSRYFAITQKGDDKVIGGGGIYFKEPFVYSIGLWLSDNNQGKGYGTEVFRSSIRYSFEVLHAEEIYAYYYNWNIVSKRMCFHHHFSVMTEASSSEEKTCVKLDKITYQQYLNDYIS